MRDPFKIDQSTCISFSGGRTSAYMVWRVLQSNAGLPPDTVICFANTGKEVEATLRFVRECGERWHVPIHWLEYRDAPPGFAVVDFSSASRQGEPFEALIRKRQYLPNPVARGCTSYGARGIVNSTVWCCSVGRARRFQRRRAMYCQRRGMRTLSETGAATCAARPSQRR